MEKIILALRHGAYHGCDEDPLSEAGVEQVKTVSGLFSQYLSSVNLKKEAKLKLIFSFSTTARAIQTSKMFLSYSEDMITTSLFLPCREDWSLSKADKVVDMVLARMKHWNVSVGVIIGHGVTPAVIAETVARRWGKKEYKELDYPGTSRGYLCNFTDEEVLSVTPEGIKVIKEPEEEIEMPVVEDKVPSNRADRPERSHKTRSWFDEDDTKSRHLRYRSDSDFDDDIPF